MGRNFLTLSRHGTTFYFRRRVPNDLRSILGKAYLVKSLGSYPLGAAIILARALAAQTDQLFQRLRFMKKNKPEDIQVDYTLEIELGDFGTPRKIRIDATPEESAAVELALTTALQNLSASAQTPSLQLKSTPQISAQELFDDFFRDGAGSERWRDADKAKKREYDPIWPRFAKHANQNGLTVDAAKAYRSEVLAEDVAIKTKHRNLYRISAVVKFGVEHHGLDPAMLTPLKFAAGGRGGKPKAANYFPFSQQDLEALFHSDAYENNAFKKPSHFWLPMLGLYTGARLEELAGLHLSAFSIVDGVHAVTISDEETTSGGKNDYSLRTIPVHHELIQAGLIAYVEQLRKDGHHRLFPDIGRAERDGFAKRATVDFMEYRRSVGVGQAAGERSRKVFHSFRSTLSGKLFELGVDGDLSRRLIGHAAIDVHQGVYLASAAIPIARASEAMNRINFGLQHPKFSDTASYKKARSRVRKESNN